MTESVHSLCPSQEETVYIMYNTRTQLEYLSLECQSRVQQASHKAAEKPHKNGGAVYYHIAARMIKNGGPENLNMGIYAQSICCLYLRFQIWIRIFKLHFLDSCQLTVRAFAVVRKNLQCHLQQTGLLELA